MGIEGCCVKPHDKLPGVSEMDTRAVASLNSYAEL